MRIKTLIVTTLAFLVLSLQTANAQTYINFATGGSTGTVDGMKADGVVASIASGYQWGKWFAEARASDLGDLRKTESSQSVTGPTTLQTTSRSVENAASSYSISFGRVFQISQGWSTTAKAGISTYNVSNVDDTSVTDYDTSTSSGSTSRTVLTANDRLSGGVYALGFRYSPQSNKRGSFQMEASRYDVLDRNSLTVSINATF